MEKVYNCNSCRGECRKGQVRVCSGCQQAYYCSTECQLKDWPDHKGYCKTVSEYCKTVSAEKNAKSSNSAAATETTAEGGSESVTTAAATLGLEPEPSSGSIDSTSKSIN